jgi:H+/Cl- antiporter ClcA
MVGTASGLFAGLYWSVLEHLAHGLRQFQGPSLLFVMPLAGLILGLVIHFLGNPGEIAVIVDNIHFRGGRLDTRKNPSMILSSLLSISAGGSAGPEAPLVQVTGSFGTWVADRFKLEGEDVRTMSLAGMAAGFTALFGAPLGGAMFALEIFAPSARFRVLRGTPACHYFELCELSGFCGNYTLGNCTHLAFPSLWSKQYR